MVKLTADERDLLARIIAKPELQPFFFRKARGLKWFEPLEERGFFLPTKNLPPGPAKQEGYVTVPFWSALEYLVTASKDLSKEDDGKYARRILEILRAATSHAREKQFSNYRTWFQCARIIRNIPLSLIEPSDIRMIDYWLDDPYERSLISTEVGQNWLVAMLDSVDEVGAALPLLLLESLFRFAPATDRPSTESKLALRIDDWHAKEIAKKVAGKSGRAIGLPAVLIFQRQLEKFLASANNDKWSSVWRRAVEDHEQDRYGHDLDHILLTAFRDCLLAAKERDREGYKGHIGEMLVSQYETVKRVGLYAINQHFGELSAYVDKVVHKAWFTSNLRHELWWLLHKRYGEFTPAQQSHVLGVIRDHVEYESEGQEHAGASAYWRAIWLAAIREVSGEAKLLYADAVAAAGSEPEHPDFSSYMRSGFVAHKSPYSVEELLALSVEELVAKLNGYQDPGEFFGPGIEGLAQVVRQVAKTEPLRYFTRLDLFESCELPYVHEVIAAFHELWTEKAALPWDELWAGTLRFCTTLISQSRFWVKKESDGRRPFVANSSWIVSQISMLIESGVKSDEHAFGEHLLPDAEAIIRVFLERVEGSDIKDTKDAVSTAINSARGRALEALINITLRSCRLADKRSMDHAEVWGKFERIYQAEFDRTDELEFATLVANYLPNFLYMSRKWTATNLDRIFERKNVNKWRCAMQGYSYVSEVYEEIYRFLRAHGDYWTALDDETLTDHVHEKVIHDIVVGYLHGFEALSDESSPLRELLRRGKEKELGRLIWLIWTLRGNKDDEILRKVLSLWGMLNEIIDPRSSGGRKLASKLSTWIAFVDTVDSSNKDLILKVAQFADESHNAYEMLEGIARISEKQPAIAFEIWSKVLEGSRPDYPDEAIRRALRNIAVQPLVGRRNAKAIADQYTRGGNSGPHEVLREIEGAGA